MVTQPFRSRWTFAVIGLAVVFALSFAPAQQVISAQRGWAAVDFGNRCEARSRSVRINPGRPPAIAGFAFDRDAPLGGQFYARLSRTPRAGSSAVLTIGNQPFLLALRGDWAWGRDPRQDQAILAAARYAGSMRIEARDAGGRRFIDRYTLGGAATAVDAAAARCAQPSKPGR